MNCSHPVPRLQNHLVWVSEKKLLVVLPIIRSPIVQKERDCERVRDTVRGEKEEKVLGKVKIAESRVWLKYQRQINKGLNWS